MDKHVPRKRFGQNFLQDQSVIARILAAIQAKDNAVVEIGPGQGALTIPLLEQLAKLTVIELDRDLIEMLKSKSANKGKLTIFNQDVLKFDFFELGHPQLNVIGNLPYNISTPLLFHLFEYLTVISEMIFMLQREVVDRICADVNDNNYSRLSVMTQFHCQTEKLFDVPPEAFYPVPKVTSSVIKMTPISRNNPKLDQQLFAKIVKQAFAQRRKVLNNNLGELLSLADFETLEISPKSRAQELSIEQFIEITLLVQAKQVQH